MLGDLILFLFWQHEGEAKKIIVGVLCNEVPILPSEFP